MRDAAQVNSVVWFVVHPQSIEARAGFVNAMALRRRRCYKPKRRRKKPGACAPSAAGDPSPSAARSRRIAGSPGAERSPYSAFFAEPRTTVALFPRSPYIESSSRISISTRSTCD